MTAARDKKKMEQKNKSLLFYRSDYWVEDTNHTNECKYTIVMSAKCEGLHGAMKTHNQEWSEIWKTTKK